MTAIFNFINRYILSYILQFFMWICGNNFALAIFLFTVLINAALIPLTVKSQKSMVQQTRIKPKLDELKKQCGDDKQKYNTEMQKLYQRENISMSGGCLPMIFRMLFLLSIYYLVTQPITYLTGVGSDVISGVANAFGLANNAGVYAPELELMLKINDPAAVAGITDSAVLAGVEQIRGAVGGLNFNFFGIDLTRTPQFSLNFAQANELWIIPILSFVSALASSIISMRLQKSANPDAPSMTGMMFITPFISLFIAFRAPCALGLYWTFSSLIASLVQAGVQSVYSPHRLLAKERAKGLLATYESEQKQLSNK